MTMQECYALLGGDYADAKSRLMSDGLIERFVLKFPNDPTMGDLKASLEKGDYESAFRFAHTLKGVAANLSFASLRESASNLTEALRANKAAPESSLVAKVSADYDKVIGAIQAYQNAR